jgi:hypothetical protein
MSEGDLITFEAMGEMEQALSPFPGTEEARIFSIFRTIRPSPDIGELDVIRKPFCSKIFLEDFGSVGIKTEVNINPVRNSSGALDPAGIILKWNPAAEQRGIISNGVKIYD